MWRFQGKYTGEAKAYIQQKRKKETTIASITFSVLCVLIIWILRIVLGGEDDVYTLICVVSGAFALLLLNAVLWINYKREPQSKIEIDNDGFTVETVDGKVTFAIFSIEKIEYYENFIAINEKTVLQKELLIDGDWAELENFLKRVEENMDTEEPVYQIEEPQAEFFNATVKSKRIYEKFVGKVSVQALVGVFEYFVTFLLEDNREMEFQIGQALYEKLQEEQTGTLVLVNGQFFDFGDGEEIE